MEAFLCQFAVEQPKCLEPNEIRWLVTKELPAFDWLEADLPVVELLPIGKGIR
ncbi:hypothetical protein RHO14_05300 [Orbus wheelerorum]|uniref:hypothetical protein n=1 Tax=Orbus wheelerorum TaxID=3074111 RepID=UPI00370D9338